MEPKEKAYACRVIGSRIYNNEIVLCLLNNIIGLNWNLL